MSRRQKRGQHRHPVHLWVLMGWVCPFALLFYRGYWHQQPVFRKLSSMDCATGLSWFSGIWISSANRKGEEEITGQEDGQSFSSCLLTVWEVTTFFDSRFSLKFYWHLGLKYSLSGVVLCVAGCFTACLASTWYRTVGPFQAVMKMCPKMSADTANVLWEAKLPPFEITAFNLVDKPSQNFLC